MRQQQGCLLTLIRSASRTSTFPADECVLRAIKAAGTHWKQIFVATLERWKRPFGMSRLAFTRRILGQTGAKGIGKYDAGAVSSFKGMRLQQQYQYCTTVTTLFALVNATYFRR